MNLLHLELPTAARPWRLDHLPLTEPHDGQRTRAMHERRQLDQARGAGDPGGAGQARGDRRLHDRHRAIRMTQHGSDVLVDAQGPDEAGRGDARWCAEDQRGQLYRVHPEVE